MTTQAYTVTPKYECPINFIDVDGVCTYTVKIPVMYSCANDEAILSGKHCIIYDYKPPVGICPLGYSPDGSGQCAKQDICETGPTVVCESGEYMESLSSCVTQYSTYATLTCPADAVFINRYCYESVMSASVTECPAGYLSCNNRCVQTLETSFDYRCPEGSIDLANQIVDSENNIVPTTELQCYKQNVQPLDYYCDNGSEPVVERGEYYCNTLKEKKSPNPVCNIDYVWDAAKESCVKYDMQPPDYICEEPTAVLHYDEYNSVWECHVQEYITATKYCENPMATEMCNGSTCASPADIPDGCSILDPVSKEAYCDYVDEQGREYVFEKNKCVYKEYADLSKVCMYGKYDAELDVCYANRYVHGDYNCPVGCDYNTTKGDCECKTLQDAQFQCSGDCYLQHHNCMRDVETTTINVCADDFSYDADKMLCTKPTSLIALEKCPADYTQEGGFCLRKQTEEKSLLCPVDYVLTSNDECTRL